MSSLLMLALVGGLAYYVFSGTESSMKQVNANDVKRVAAQPAGGPSAGLSRTEYDQQRSATFGEAVKNSSSLAAHQQHVNDSQKIMQQISNSSTK